MRARGRSRQDTPHAAVQCFIHTSAALSLSACSFLAHSALRRLMSASARCARSVASVAACVPANHELTGDVPHVCEVYTSLQRSSPASRFESGHAQPWHSHRRFAESQRSSRWSYITCKAGTESDERASVGGSARERERKRDTHTQQRDERVSTHYWHHHHAAPATPYYSLVSSASWL